MACILSQDKVIYHLRLCFVELTLANNTLEYKPQVVGEREFLITSKCLLIESKAYMMKVEFKQVSITILSLTAWV